MVDEVKQKAYIEFKEEVGTRASCEGDYFHVIVGKISAGEQELKVDFGKILLKPLKSTIIPEGLGRCNLENARKVPGIYVVKAGIKYGELTAEIYKEKEISEPILARLKDNLDIIQDGKIVPNPETKVAEPAVQPKKLVIDISTKTKEEPKEPTIADTPTEETPELTEHVYSKKKRVSKKK